MEDGVLDVLRKDGVLRGDDTEHAVLYTAVRPGCVRGVGEDTGDESGTEREDKMIHQLTEAIFPKKR